ncbi:MAG: LysR family transcriptional regulator [Lysobacterales bacterium]
MKRHVRLKPHVAGVAFVPDLNLLRTLDVLLAEGNVARAAKRLHLSASAMSRALARLRETTGDPLLVRAGRGLVPTPRALELRERIGPLVEEALALLRPAQLLDPATLTRSFALRTSEGFVDNFGPELITRIRSEAPGARLHFLLKPDKDSTPLRAGMVDLETGVIDSNMGPEIRTQGLFRDRQIGVVRAGHPLSQGIISPERFAAGDHVLFSRRAEEPSAIDEALAALGLTRRICAVVGGFSAALALARRSDLIACVPERHTAKLRADMHAFVLPLALPEFTVSMLWHPRLDADPAHRWLRLCLREVCADADHSVSVEASSPVAA